MDSKRQSQHEGDKSAQILAQPSKRRREDSQQPSTCVIGRSVLNIETDIVPVLAGLAQRVVREEFDSQLRLRSTINETGPSGAEFFKLIFMNDLPATIVTLEKIKARDDKPVEIALYDIRSQSIITDGPRSSIKIKICVLNGEFGSNGREGWTTDEFKANISRERENKGKLLKGDTVITLENGVGHIAKIMFTDNSKCTRSRRFRLGAMAQSTSDEANIKEAISNPFMVKGSRVTQKHYPPSPNDEIWRLTNISKDGKIHKRLSDELGINTVEDLLQQLETNPSSLQEKFGKNSTKLWEAIKHAKTCYPAVTSQGQNNHSQNTLNFDEKRLEQQHTYRNVKDFIPVDETSTHSFPSPLASLQIAGQCREELELLAAQQGQSQMLPNLSQPSTSKTSHINEGSHSDQVVYSQLPQLAEMPLDWSAGEQLISEAYIGENGWPVSGSQIDQFSSYFVTPTPWELVDPFYIPCGYGAESSNTLPNSGVSVSSKGKRKTVWNKIRNALKWIIPHAAKRKAKLFHYQC